MITAALLDMNVKNGSSWHAIANYIICEFKTVDATLLTRCLREMKKMGKLVMNKRSYMLPGSGDGVGAGQSQSQSVVVEGSSVGGKRKPGRPPKMQSNDGGVEGENGGGGGSVNGAVGITTPAPSNMVPMGEVDGGSGVLGVTDLVPVPLDPIGVVPNVVPVGEVDGGSGVLGVTSLVLVPFDPIGGVRNVVPMVEGDEGTVVKWHPGGPSKMQVVAVEAEPIAVAEPGVGGEMVRVGRKSGRPPKLSKGKGVVSVARNPVRPTKVNDEIVVGDGEMGDAGRPSKLAVRRKPRKLSGKPLGRPKKGASVLATQSLNRQQLTFFEDLKRRFEQFGASVLATQSLSQQQSISFEDLKRRYEQFQSRVKHAVDVVKPYFSNEIAPDALEVVQEIEGLALMDVCAPVPGELIGDSEAVAGPSGAPLSDGGQLSDPVAAFSAQGSEPPN